jgi:acetoin utilization protein AcuB
MQVGEIMTPGPATISPEQTVRDALELMQELDIRHVLIAREGSLVGILSDRDLRDLTVPTLLRFEEPDVARNQLETPVSEVMRTDTMAIDVAADLTEVVEVMLDTKVGALPVTDNATGALVGIVSYVDVLRICQDRL